MAVAVAVKSSCRASSPAFPCCWTSNQGVCVWSRTTSHRSVGLVRMSEPSKGRRSERATAGNRCAIGPRASSRNRLTNRDESRLQKLLDQEEEADEFYEQDLFKEEENDEEFYDGGRSFYLLCTSFCLFFVQKMPVEMNRSIQISISPRKNFLARPMKQTSTWTSNRTRTRPKRSSRQSASFATM